jgi:hypothetical protein
MDIVTHELNSIASIVMSGMLLVIRAGQETCTNLKKKHCIVVPVRICDANLKKVLYSRSLSSNYIANVVMEMAPERTATSDN